MKKLSTTATHGMEKLQTPQLTIGLDLGDCSSYYWQLIASLRSLPIARLH